MIGLAAVSARGVARPGGPNTVRMYDHSTRRTSVATTLLAIDDSVTMRKVLELTFAGEDYRLVTAESGDAALAKLRAERPSVVLCDVTLDGPGGYALCAKIKADHPGVRSEERRVGKECRCRWA